MNKLAFLFIAAFSSLAFSSDEMHIAHFDGKRVFESYQHTKDVEQELTDKRHLMGPASVTDLTEERETLKRRLIELIIQIKEAASGTDNLDRLQSKLNLINIELELNTLKEHLAEVDKVQSASIETRRQRTSILLEILSEAKLMSTERGYFLVIPEGLPPEDAPLSIIVTAKGEDITDELIRRLNQRYAVRRN